MRAKQVIIAALSGLLVLGASGTVNAKSKVKKVDNRTTVANVVFKPTSESDLTNYVYDTVDPTAADYHQYLTPDQFAAKFGQSNSYIDSFKQYLAKYHLQATTFSGNLALKVKGHRVDMNRAFNAKYIKEKGRESRTQYKLPGKLSNQVVAVIGVYAEKPVSKKPTTKKKVAKKAAAKKHVITSAGLPTDVSKPDTTLSDNQFSNKYGAGKFAKQYQLNQLYNQGLSGKGQRIGIISTGDFKMSDLQKYWQQTGVNSSLSQIHKIYTIDNAKTSMDNMKKALSPYQMEASLDVQSASAVAPNADIDFYVGNSVNDATTSPAASFATFAQAISSNQDQQISTSFSPSVELTSHWNDHSASLKQYNHAFNLLLEQAAAQGITVFRASGDYGPREMAAKRENHPVSTSPYQVIVGGTTLPYQKIIKNKLVTVNKERAWGDTYTASATEIKQGIFPGSGGGFSALNPTPRYQQGFPGVNTFRAVDSLKYSKGKMVINKQPRVIFGTGNSRNLPDVSGNADSQTGYATYFSGDQLSVDAKKKSIIRTPSKIWMVSGGTSYTAPQMAAANAVMNSGRQTRIGFWNPQIYKFAAEPDTPFNVLDDADNNSNLYYTGQPGKLYNQATGLGTINFDKLFNKFNGETGSNR
ncbi:MAG: S53 family peptidase [Lentilactobacillus diolivorans]|jgi:subtilase family serine protease|nr:S53 family peptidase [Lentilactobacillus diolivorans]RRG02594.1 MAG: peptidase S53 [Lactobacillus sp.]